MSQHASDFPFAYRLPTDVAAEIRRTAGVETPLVAMGSPRRRLLVLVLVLGLFGGGLALALPSSSAQSMRSQDCGPGWVVDAVGTVSADESLGC
jgi:hypothetical protein